MRDSCLKQNSRVLVGSAAQLGNHGYFKFLEQPLVKSCCFRILKFDHTLRCFSMERQGNMDYIELSFCMANLKDQFVFMIQSPRRSKRYSLTRDRWEELPPISNKQASACSLGDKVYTFACFFDSNIGNLKSSISVLHNAGACISSQKLRWQVLEWPLSPRKQVVFAPLNQTKIAILGGKDYNFESLKDSSLIFNTATCEFKQAFENDESPSFWCRSNQAVKVCENSIIALTESDDSEKRLIKFIKKTGDKSSQHLIWSKLKKYD